MSDITVTFKNETILTMDASGSKPLLTQGKYCEDDISITYVKPATPSGTKQISITQNGTTTEDVAAYANAEINVNVQGGGTEVTAISSASNAIDCRTLLFPGAVADHLYVAVLKTLASGTKIADQVEFLYSVGSTGNIGGGVRWRNNAHGVFGMTVTYDANIQTGDVFLCYDFPLV